MTGHLIGLPGCNAVAEPAPLQAKTFTCNKAPRPPRLQLQRQSPPQKHPTALSYARIATTGSVSSAQGEV
ncbi:hypothetical protein PC116_g20754 [Phytophthora cactorum]|nr:hypothetical protein PC114_g18439 [Phytophthora cactorum]KAG3138326.1 hypothetical protein C6341_g20703 [Phytophthora cactorum]KAG4049570.1 hypothetical protein PC123_g15165 [Phytophthora cactorum]KAG4230960.1 hypothetical protein PC116_g20754 [Phytophthora cactorum]